MLSLLIVIGILAVWAISGIKNAVTPPDPPIENIEEYTMRMFQQCRNQKEARKFIKQDAARRRR